MFTTVSYKSKVPCIPIVLTFAYVQAYYNVHFMFYDGEKYDIIRYMGLEENTHCIFQEIFKIKIDFNFFCEIMIYLKYIFITNYNF